MGAFKTDAFSRPVTLISWRLRVLFRHERKCLEKGLGIFSVPQGFFFCPVCLGSPMPVKAQFPGEQSEAGEFERQEDAFRDFVSTDGSTPYPAAAGRYHLYISLACPWASRTLIVRKLRGLEEAVGMTVVDPVAMSAAGRFATDPATAAIQLTVSTS